MHDENGAQLARAVVCQALLDVVGGDDPAGSQPK